MSELKPGRELDALVAEKIFKAKLVYSAFADDIISCDFPDRKFGHHFPRLPAYSTSIEAAWEVLNKFPRWTLERNGKGKYICLIPAERIFLYVSSTAPMAICLAALNASGYVFEESKK